MARPPATYHVRTERGELVTELPHQTLSTAASKMGISPGYLKQALVFGKGVTSRWNEGALVTVTRTRP